MLPGYREYRPPAQLASVVACLWEQERDEDHVQRVAPDGCVDLIWLADRELMIAGPDTGPRFVDVPADALCTGIRLRPGAAGAVLGLPASELRDSYVDAARVWGQDAERLAGALCGAEPSTRLEVLAAALAERVTEPDPLIAVAARELARHHARIPVVAASVGLSERQLHRRIVASVGYGPKMLARVARLRRLVALPAEPLAARALDAGYASQAHMSEEVRRLTGLTAARFLADAALTAA